MPEVGQSLSVSSVASRRHSPLTLGRRDLLRVGALGIAGGGGVGLAPLGVGLPQLLASPGERTAPAKACLFIVQYGGASHHDSFDLKPDAPAEIRGPYRPIDTSVPGLRICELLPRLAGMADRFALIRSMTHGNPGHDGGMHVCMTGHSLPAENTPYFGSVVSRLRPSTANVPSYVWLQNLAGDVQPRYLNGGYLGAAHGPLRVGTDLDNPSSSSFRFTAFDPPAGVSQDRLDDRQRLLADLDPVFGAAAPPYRDFTRFQEQAVDLVSAPTARRAFDLDQESASVRDRYGRGPLGQNLLLARRLIEAGVRLVTVVAWTGTPPGETFRNVQTWDMHGDGPGLGSIFGTTSYGLSWALPRVDLAVSALLEDLEDRGLLDETLVAMVGEFGRSPRISLNGRDHWPACYSAFLAGGGIHGGQVIGASDAQGAYVKDRPVSPEMFGATLFDRLGIAPETRFGPDGFSQRVSDGEPVRELLQVAGPRETIARETRGS